jgi:hypothetical protein
MKASTRLFASLSLSAVAAMLAGSHATRNVTAAGGNRAVDLA